MSRKTQEDKGWGIAWQDHSSKKSVEDELCEDCVSKNKALSISQGKTRHSSGFSFTLVQKTRIKHPKLDGERSYELKNECAQLKWGIIVLYLPGLA